MSLIDQIEKNDERLFRALERYEQEPTIGRARYIRKLTKTKNELYRKHAEEITLIGQFIGDDK